MIKKIFKILLLAFFSLFLFLDKASAVEEKIRIYFFWSKSCPHCHREKLFLDKLISQYPQLELKSLEISSFENLKLWQEVGNKLEVKIGGTPFTVIGTQYFSGFLDDETTGKQIEAVVKDALENGCYDVIEECEVMPPEDIPAPETISLPFFGELRLQSISLPLLTVVMGVLDGFNPCAMWTLLFLISLLLGIKEKKRMWALGTAFIITSAGVYFLFLAAWLNFFLLIGFIPLIRIIVALAALSIGVFGLRSWYLNRQGGCEIIADDKRKKTFAKIRRLTQRKEFLIALAGIIFLAFAVNLVELVCSAGLPAVYTQVLSLSKLPAWKYYFYLSLYTFFFMVDDLFVFFTAMITLQAVGIEARYARYSRLFGGLVILLIGLLLLFKPEWLMF